MASSRGTVKFFNPEKGWGALVSPYLPHDLWVHFSVNAGTSNDAIRTNDADTPGHLEGLVPARAWGFKSPLRHQFRG